MCTAGKPPQCQVYIRDYNFPKMYAKMLENHFTLDSYGSRFSRKTSKIKFDVSYVIFFLLVFNNFTPSKAGTSRVRTGLQREKVREKARHRLGEEVINVERD